MAKITINGEVFEFDRSRKPLSEALAIEKALGVPYIQFEEGLRNGSARSAAAFIWLVWRRNGRDVPLADLLSGAVDVDLDALEIDDGEEGEGSAVPTTPTPAASSTTAAGTSARSRKSSGSARGSGSS
jgi:hypothetical protein